VFLEATVEPNFGLPNIRPFRYPNCICPDSAEGVIGNVERVTGGVEGVNDGSRDRSAALDHVPVDMFDPRGTSHPNEYSRIESLESYKRIIRVSLRWSCTLVTVLTLASSFIDNDPIQPTVLKPPSAVAFPEAK
jgi:hypothetical protein